MWRRILHWWRRDTEDQDLNEELRAHISIETREQLGPGRRHEAEGEGLP